MRAIGDPTEGALLLAAKALGFDKDELEQEWPRVDEVPFTSERKRMTTVHKISPVVKQSDLPWNEPYIMLTKGAVDSLLGICERVLVNNEFAPWMSQCMQGSRGLILSLPNRDSTLWGFQSGYVTAQTLPEDEDMVEKDGIFIGLVAMINPPRPEVEKAVAAAETAAYGR